MSRLNSLANGLSNALLTVSDSFLSIEVSAAANEWAVESWNMVRRSAKKMRMKDKNTIKDMLLEIRYNQLSLHIKTVRRVLKRLVNPSR